MIGLLLTGLISLSLIGIGCFAIVSPRASAVQYGIVLDDARSLAYLRAMGVRDLVIGVLLLLLVGAGQPELVAIGVAASSAVAMLDTIVVSRDGAKGRVLQLHGGGAAGLLVTAVVLALGF